MPKLIIALMFALLLALATTVVPFAQLDGDGTSVVYADNNDDQGEDNDDQGEDGDDQGEDED